MNAGNRLGERGAVGGLEALALGMLVLVAGSLLVLNAWAVVDTRAALDAAAREYLRSYTEQRDLPTAQAKGEAAALQVLDDRGTPLRASLHITAPAASSFGPCGDASVELSAVVETIRLPFIAGLGRTDVTVRHNELIDAHREIDANTDFRPELTACAAN